MRKYQFSYDEFAFFNQQLAGMLKSGVPLEGALRQLSKTMDKGRLKGELEALEKDLADGIPLGEALARRKLPPVYVNVLRAGAESGNLAGILILLGDYYSRLHAITGRLRGLMVYPFIVLACSLGLSLFLSITYSFLLSEVREYYWGALPALGASAMLFWIAPGMFVLMLAALVFAFSRRSARQWIRWNAPGLKEAALAESASTISTMLSGGARFDESLRLLEQVEEDTPAARDIRTWQEQLRQGHRRFDEIAVRSRVFPPLFTWLVAQGGEDMAQGFRRAADIYAARAATKTDMMLYAALPLTVAFIGLLILGQVVSVVGLVSRILSQF